MSNREMNIRSCQASAERWKRCASNLREHATRAHLTEAGHDMLLREAEAADRQAGWWIAGAEDYASS